jgi:hypothetical protein
MLKLKPKLDHGLYLVPEAVILVRSFECHQPTEKKTSWKRKTCQSDVVKAYFRWADCDLCLVHRSHLDLHHVFGQRGSQIGRQDLRQHSNHKDPKQKTLKSIFWKNFLEKSLKIIILLKIRLRAFLNVRSGSERFQMSDPIWTKIVTGNTGERKIAEFIIKATNIYNTIKTCAPSFTLCICMHSCTIQHMQQAENCNAHATQCIRMQLVNDWALHEVHLWGNVADVRIHLFKLFRSRYKEKPIFKIQ